MNSIFIEIKGIVQGVGFRPFIYKLALSNNLFGWVNNDSSGVNISLEGCKRNIENFLLTLKENPPSLCKIDSINIKEKKYENFSSFEIIESEKSLNKTTIISPDIAICDDCINDINDKDNFRFEYALTNCTNCGPRYSIIRTVPYDRVNTSMAEFPLCDDCKKEYENPLNRRYHAQPVACEKCGPTITLYDKNNNQVAKNIEAIKTVASKINGGEIVAIKGMGGFHLICDATNDKTIKELRKRKNRPTKPFAVMFRNLDELKQYVSLNRKEEEVLSSKEKPITIISSKKIKLSEYIAPKIDRVGCFIAYTPLHLILFKYLNKPIVATSANLSDEPIIRFKDEIIDKLSNVVDFILDFNRDIINACDDSVVQIVNNDIQVLRNARGYAPLSIKLAKKTNKKILALGANQKSTIALAFDNNLVISPHIGDLNSINSLEYFNRTIETFKRFYDFEPEIIVCDKHPNYESVKWAKQQNIELVQVQHHYAHVLATMAEHNLREKVLAFSFDGTGYGDDGNIWGGEVFIANKKEYKRINYFENFKLIGGEKSIKEPKRVALSLLFDIYTLEEVLALDIECIKSFSQKEIKLFHKVWSNNLNTPLTSSVGRLFDAIASLSGLLHNQSYEGETGLLIEQNYDSNIKSYYSFEIRDKKIEFKEMIREIVNENEIEKICSKFMNTLVQIIISISSNYEKLPILLSGGVFQNKILLNLLIDVFKKQNKKLYYSNKIPLNDAGISSGQIFHLV